MRRTAISGRTPTATRQMRFSRNRMGDTLTDANHKDCGDPMFLTSMMPWGHHQEECQRQDIVGIWLLT